MIEAPIANVPSPRRNAGIDNTTASNRPKTVSSGDDFKKPNASMIDSTNIGNRTIQRVKIKYPTASVPLKVGMRKRLATNSAETIASFLSGEIDMRSVRMRPTFKITGLARLLVQGPADCRAGRCRPHQKSTYFAHVQPSHPSMAPIRNPAAGPRGLNVCGGQDCTSSTLAAPSAPHNMVRSSGRSRREIPDSQSSETIVP